jgi:hypothetical protein
MKATVEELDVFSARVLGANMLRDVFNPAAHREPASLVHLARLLGRYQAATRAARSTATGVAQTSRPGRCGVTSGAYLFWDAGTLGWGWDMDQRGIAHAVGLVVVIACAWAVGCPSRGGTNGNASGKVKSDAGHQARDGGSLADAAIGDGGERDGGRRDGGALDSGISDAGRNGSAGKSGGTGSGGTMLTAPPASYNCTFGSDASTGHGYWFCATKTLREPARRLCRDLGGDADFVIIDNAQENAMVADKITTDSYIGYSDALVVGTWIWVDGSKGSYTNWDTKQPGVEQFAFMEKSNGKWKVTFEKTLLGFVCEGPKLKKP